VAWVALVVWVALVAWVAWVVSEALAEDRAAGLAVAAVGGSRQDSRDPTPHADTDREASRKPHESL
jgi:hypothetical protein